MVKYGSIIVKILVLKLIEVQMSAEGGAFSRGQMDQLMDLAEVGVGRLVKEQAKALT